MAHQHTLDKISSLKQSVSARKADANRQNALKSTGPKTPRGKAYSRRNSLRHGFFAKDLFSHLPFSKEDPQEFQRLLVRLLQELQPVGVLEELEVERIAVCSWRLARVWRYENAEICAGTAKVMMGEAESKSLRGEMTPQDRALVSLLETAGEEIRIGGVISPALMEEMVANPSLEPWWQMAQEQAEEMVDKFSQALDQELAPSEIPPTRALRVAYLTVQMATVYLERAPNLLRDCFMNVEYGQQAIPNREAVDKILRYQAAIERDLGRAYDRLERLQRRRKGELIPPPLNLHVTREI